MTWTEPPVVGTTETATHRPVATTPRTPLLLAAIGVVLTAWHLHTGVGFVLDDWFTLGHARFEGAWAAAGAEQWHARPGAGVTYAVAFGLLADHPGVTVGLLGAVAVATAVALWSLLRRFVPERIATVAAVLWLVQPNHVSLEVWISAANISLSVLLVVVGAVVMLRPTRGHRAVATALFLVATLSYEAVLPVIAVGTVALPWLDRRRVDRPLVASVAITQFAAVLWIVANWHPAKDVKTWVDLSQVPAAHLGWGVVPDGPVAQATLLVAMVGVLVLLGRLLTRRDECGAVEWSVLAGLVVIALGVVPFVRYFYAPLGAGDRFNFVSALGGALIWAALVEAAWRGRRGLGPAALGVLVLLALVARWDRVELWSTAAQDAEAIRAAAVEQVPTPDGVVVVAPPAVQIDNVAAFLDQSNVQPALQLAYDDEGIEARMAATPEDADRTDPDLVVDVADVVRLDEVCNPISDLLGACEGRPGR